MTSRILRAALAAGGLCLLGNAAPVMAQETAPAPAAAASAQDDADDADGPTIAPYEAPDPATLKMPALEFTSTPEVVADFDKYFFFHREGTSYTEAYGDIRECDALASGSSIYLNGGPGAAAAAAQYGVLAAGVGSAIGGAIADAIFGAAARREQRRVSVRNCMAFKGYARYGLSGDLWKEFNFEEGNGRKKEAVRNADLALQALVASGPKPAGKELGL